MDAHIVFGRFQDVGIRCWLKDENIVTINPIWTQATGGIKLMVAEDQVEEAQNLIAEFIEEKRARFRCPVCESGNIEYISTNRKPANWFSVLFGFLLTSYAIPLQIWHCFQCNAEFEEPKEVVSG